MKNKTKYIIIIFLSLIIFVFINILKNNNKIYIQENINFNRINNYAKNTDFKTNILKTSIFEIIEKKEINLDTTDNKLKNFDYKNIEDIKQVGYGFFINDSGNFLTSKHLFNKYSKKYYIKINNISYNFDIIKKYEKKDLVLGKINNYKNINFLKINKSKNIKLDTVVFTINDKQINYGKIILLNKKLINLKLNNLIETNIKLKPGNSGSPLFDKNGIVIGINTAINEVKNTSFAEIINISIF